MPWTCPACRTAIRHDGDMPRPQTVYRCPVCHLELVLDDLRKRLTLAPLATEPVPVEQRRRPKRKSIFTSRPETAPPMQKCPQCDEPLVYQETVIGGVKPLERWDYYKCRTCGVFTYRHRTRKLTRRA